MRPLRAHGMDFADDLLMDLLRFEFMGGLAAPH
jgi:hypothetical protein